MKIQEVEMRNDNLTLDIRHRLDYVTGMNRTIPTTQGELHSVQRNTGIAGRIQRAEAAERNPTLVAQRDKEYKERINKLINPETVLVEENKDALG